MKHYRFGGRWNLADRYSDRVFFVPDKTLLAAEARQLGITSAEDLFGGVVPYHFVTTKAITHERISDMQWIAGKLQLARPLGRGGRSRRWAASRNAAHRLTLRS